MEFRLAEQTREQFNEDASSMTPNQVKMMKELKQYIKETG